jgi:hypothetical protein
MENDALLDTLLCDDNEIDSISIKSVARIENKAPSNEMSFMTSSYGGSPSISLSRNIGSILFERDSTSIVIWFKLFAAAKSWSVSMEVSLAAAVSECVLGLLAYLSGLLFPRDVRLFLSLCTRSDPDLSEELFLWCLLSC